MGKYYILLPLLNIDIYHNYKGIPKREFPYSHFNISKFTFCYYILSNSNKILHNQLVHPF